MSIETGAIFIVYYYYYYYLLFIIIIIGMYIEIFIVLVYRQLFTFALLKTSRPPRSLF